MKETVGQLMQDMGREARAAALVLAAAGTSQKNHALRAAAAALRERRLDILAANDADMRDARSRGLPGALLDRLLLNDQRVETMARGLEDIERLDGPHRPDPGRVDAAERHADRTRLRALGRHRHHLREPPQRYRRCRRPVPEIEQRRHPAGRLGERPVECGDSFMLGGGVGNRGSAPACIQLVPTTDRAAVGYMLAEMSDSIDVIVPRGGKELIARVRQEARVPVIGHLEGVCHVYVDRGADLQMAKHVVLNAKMRRTGICGSAETLLVDRACAATHLPSLIKPCSTPDAKCAARRRASESMRA